MKAKQLVDGEYVILETKAHAFVLFAPFFKFLAWTLTLVTTHGLLVRNRNYVLRHMNDSGILFSVQQWLADGFEVSQVLIGVCGATVLMALTCRILRWSNARYIITNRRVLLKKGFFGQPRQALAFDLSALKDGDILLKRNLVQRCAGSGDIIIQSSGFFSPEAGRYVGNGGMTLKNVPQAGKIVAIVIKERGEAETWL